MSNKYINLYMGDVTEGGSDGIPISTDNTETSPLEITLDAANNESKTVKVAVRCEPGFITTGNTAITFVGSNSNKWVISASENSSLESSLIIRDSINETNKILYIKALSTADEDPVIDSSTNIRITTKIKAV